MVTLWVNRGESNIDLLQDMLETIYFIDPNADIGHAERWRITRLQSRRGQTHRLVLCIQTTEQAVAYAFGGLKAAGGVYFDKGVGNGVIPIATWTPQGNTIELRHNYLYRAPGEGYNLCSANSPSTTGRWGLAEINNVFGPRPVPKFRHPNTREDRSKSLRELSQ